MGWKGATGPVPAYEATHFRYPNTLPSGGGGGKTFQRLHSQTLIAESEFSGEEAGFSGTVIHLQILHKFYLSQTGQE